MFLDLVFGRTSIKICLGNIIKAESYYGIFCAAEKFSLDTSLRKTRLVTRVLHSPIGSLGDVATRQGGRHAVSQPDPTNSS